MPPLEAVSVPPVRLHLGHLDGLMVVDFATFRPLQDELGCLTICPSFAIQKNLSATSIPQLCSVIVEFVPDGEKPSAITISIILFQARVLWNQCHSNGFNLMRLRISLYTKTCLCDFVQNISWHVPGHLAYAFFGFYVFIIGLFQPQFNVMRQRRNRKWRRPHWMVSWILRWFPRCFKKSFWEHISWKSQHSHLNVKDLINRCTFAMTSWKMGLELLEFEFWRHTQSEYTHGQ